MKKEKYKIIGGGKITFEMPEITIDYYENKYEKHAEIMAELISIEIKKPEFAKKMSEAVNEVAKNILNSLPLQQEKDIINIKK